MDADEHSFFDGPGRQYFLGKYLMPAHKAPLTPPKIPQTLPPTAVPSW